MCTPNKPTCDRDCFHCPYPDCILDEEDMSPEEWHDSAERERSIKREGRSKVAAQQAAYRQANKEKIAAYQAAWCRANKEKKGKAPPGLTHRAGQRNNKNPSKILCSCADYSTGERENQ